MTRRPFLRIKTFHPYWSVSFKSVKFLQLSFPHSRTNATSIFSVLSHLWSETNCNSNGISQPCIQRLQIKSNKSSRCTKSIAKECKSSKRSKLQDSIEGFSPPITSLRLRVITPHILMNHLTKITRAQSLMTEKKIAKEEITMKIHLKKISSVKFCWTKKEMTAKSRLMLLAASKWEKAPSYQVKTFLTSDKSFLNLIFYYFSVFLQYFFT